MRIRYDNEDKEFIVNITGREYRFQPYTMLKDSEYNYKLMLDSRYRQQLFGGTPDYGCLHRNGLRISCVSAPCRECIFFRDNLSYNELLLLMRYLKDHHIYYHGQKVKENTLGDQ